MKSGFLLTAALALAATSPAQATSVVFSGATATFHQTFDRNWDAPEMIDGTLSGSNGWAVFLPGSGPQAASALFTLATPLTAGSYSFTFTLYHQYNERHNLGDFSIGYTNSTSPTLASASSIVTLSSATSAGGATMNLLAGNEIVVSGINPLTDIYTVTGTVTSATAITGIFLNALKSAGNNLPANGPGRAVNGNFVVSEFTADAVRIATAVPEPASWAMMIAGFGIVGAAARRRRGLVVA